MSFPKTLVGVCATGALCAMLLSNHGNSAVSDFVPIDPHVVPPVVTALVPPSNASHAKKSSSRAHAHPHGKKVCASGCALSNHPTPLLLKSEFLKLVSQLSNSDDRQKAIDSLLFYGPQTKQRLRLTSGLKIAAADRQLLDRELKRERVLVEFRLTGVSGRVLATLPDTNVPLDIRHEFDLEEDGIPHLLASGTVKRVGQYHLWARL